MSPGITFRCTCDHCGTIFFSPDRKANACPKCAKRHRLRLESPPQQASEEENDLLAAALSSAVSTDRAPIRRRSVAPRSASATVSLSSSHPTADSPAAPAAASPLVGRGPRSAEPTEENRAAILRAYAEYEGRNDVPLRRLHAEIAEKTNLARSLVAQVLSEVRTVSPTVTEEQRLEIIARYRDFVRRMERPPEGRRTAIAHALNLSRHQVVAVVREWASSQPSITDMTREDLFRVERAFFQASDGTLPLEEVSRRIASELGYTEWQVERWIDLLHDGDFRDVEEVAPDQEQATIAAYIEYLQGDSPPPRSLHVTLAERFGLSPRQVHKVLVEYRRKRRKEIFGF